MNADNSPSPSAFIGVHQPPSLLRNPLGPWPRLRNRAATARSFAGHRGASHQQMIPRSVALPIRAPQPPNKGTSMYIALLTLTLVTAVTALAQSPEGRASFQ